MANPDTLVLSDGGLKSLVATATLGRAAQPMLLFIHDGRPSDVAHHAMFLKQAEHFEATRRIELSLPHLIGGDASSLRVMPLARFQYLTAAAGQAVRLGARRLVWPVRVGDAFEAVSQIAEALVLLEHAARVESDADLRIETPLLDMTMAQVIELGEQMAVPWRISRSCIATAGPPCGACAACRSRADGFEQVGIGDPAQSEVAASAAER